MSHEKKFRTSKFLLAHQYLILKVFRLFMYHFKKNIRLETPQPVITYLKWPTRRQKIMKGRIHNVLRIESMTMKQYPRLKNLKSTLTYLAPLLSSLPCRRPWFRAIWECDDQLTQRRLIYSLFVTPNSNQLTTTNWSWSFQKTDTSSVCFQN